MEAAKQHTRIKVVTHNGKKSFLVDESKHCDRLDAEDFQDCNYTLSRQGDVIAQGAIEIGIDGTSIYMFTKMRYKKDDFTTAINMITPVSFVVGDILIISRLTS